MFSSSSKRLSAILALGATALAVATHLYLALENYKLKSGFSGKSVCNINAQFNCDAVALSPYAQFLGIPMAIWGAAINVVLLVFLIVTLTSDSKRYERGSFWLSLVIFLGSVVMGSISFFLMHTFCLFCLTAYALSILQFGAVWTLQTTSPLKSLGGDLRQVWSEQLSIPILIAMVPAGAWLGHSMIGDAYGLSRVGPMIRESIFDWQSAQAFTFKDEGLHLKNGSGPIKMQIVEFADFLCPHCKHAAPTLHNFVEGRPDVELIFKPYPLDGTCNSGGSSKGDGLRCQLAALVMCSESLAQKGWMAFDWVFEHQEDMPGRFQQTLQEIAKMTGTPEDQLKSCVESSETQDRIAKFADEGNAAKITGTPTLFVNGRHLPNGQLFPILEGAYKAIKSQ